MVCTCARNCGGFYIWLRNLFLHFMVSKIWCYAIYLTYDRASHSTLKINGRNLSAKNQGWKECPCYAMVLSRFGRLQQCLLSIEFPGYCTCLIQIFREEVNLSLFSLVHCTNETPQIWGSRWPRNSTPTQIWSTSCPWEVFFFRGRGIKCPSWI